MSGKRECHFRLMDDGVVAAVFSLTKQLYPLHLPPLRMHIDDIDSSIILLLLYGWRRDFRRVLYSARCTDFGGCFRGLDQIRWSVAVDSVTDRVPDVVLLLSSIVDVGTDALCVIAAAAVAVAVVEFSSRS